MRVPKLLVVAFALAFLFSTSAYAQKGAQFEFEQTKRWIK